MNTRRMLAAAGAAALMAVAPASSAQAAKPRIDLNGSGTFAVSGDGAAVVTGTATGKPFGGSFTAVLRAHDGTLPGPGECEPGSVTVSVDGPRGRYLDLESSDEVCGIHIQPPYVVTHAFTGRYDVTASSERRLQGTDGFLEVRLANDGRGVMFAIDT